MNSAGPIINLDIDQDDYPVTGHRRVDLHLRTFVDKVVMTRFKEELREWVQNDSGLLRTQRGIRREVSDEALTLLEALGPWVLVNSDDLFHPGVAAWEANFLHGDT